MRSVSVGGGSLDHQAEQIHDEDAVYSDTEEPWCIPAGSPRCDVSNTAHLKGPAAVFPRLNTFSRPLTVAVPKARRSHVRVEPACQRTAAPCASDHAENDAAASASSGSVATGAHLVSFSSAGIRRQRPMPASNTVRRPSLLRAQ